MKKFTLRTLMIFAVTVLLLSTATLIRVLASSGTDSVVVSDDVTVSISYETNNGSYNVTTKTLSEKSASSSGLCGTTYTPKTATLTLKNMSDQKTVTFSFTVVDNGGSYATDGSGFSIDGSTVVLQAEGEIKFSIESSKSDNEITLTCSDFSVVDQNAVHTVAMTATEGGKVTANGTVTPAGSTVEYSATFADGITFTAAADSNHEFYGYVNDKNVLISQQSSYKMTPSGNAQIKALFKKKGAAVFGIGNARYIDLGDACAAASAKDVIVALESGTVPAGTYNIPKNVTLLVPFDDAHTLYTTSPYCKQGSGSDPVTTSVANCYCKLNVASGATINLADGAAISVSARVLCTHNSAAYNGAVTGKYGQINMEDGAVINLNGSSKLYAWGFITGKGHIYANDTSEVYEDLQINDWRGGTNASEMEDTNQFPFTQYYVQNIECYLTIKGKAKETVWVAVYALRSVNSKRTPFIGSDGVFRLSDADSSVTKFYNPDTDKIEYTINGNASIGAIEIYSYSSADYYLPINNSEITVESGTLNCDKTIVLLPGSSVKVNEGAAVNVTGEGVVAVAGKEIGTYCATGDTAAYPAIPARFVPTRTPANIAWSAATNNSRWENTEPAYIDNNGTITVASTAVLASTVKDDSSTAVMYSSEGTGVFDIQGSTTCPTLDCNNINKGAVTPNPVSTEDAVLQNDDEVGGSYDTAVRWEPGKAAVFSQNEEGVWGDYRYLEFYEDEDAAAAYEYKHASYEDDPPKPVSPDQLEAYVAAHDLTMSGYVDGDTFYDFNGWKVDQTILLDFDDDGKEDNVVMLLPSYKEYCTIKWLNDDGTEIKTDLVEKGTSPTPPTATKDSDNIYNYTFKGWTPKIDDPVTKSATYMASYTPTEIFNKHSLTLDGKIGVNFYVMLPSGYNTTNTTMDFSWGNKYIATNTYSDTESYTATNVEGKDEGELTKYTVYVAAKELNDEITAELKDANGDVISTQTYSGTEYAYQLLAKTDDELNAIAKGNNGAGLRATVVSMLNYCAASQENFQYHVDDLANARLSEANQQFGDVGELTAPDFGDVSWGWYYGSSVNLGSDNAYSVYLIKNDRNSTIAPTITYTRPDGSSRVDDTTGSCEITEAALAIRATVSNIPAAEVLKTITLNIDGSDHEINIGSYIKTVLNSDSSTAELKDAVTALYHYGTAAQAYFV